MIDSNLIMIVAGEASADARAAGMVRELRALHPGVEVYGVGGQALAAAGAELLFDFSRAGVVGLLEVLPELGRFYRAYRTLAQSVAERRPVGVVLLDLPDFNLLLARKLRRVAPETRIIYYISPQVWAWRKGRVKTIAARADAMLTLFPFEVDLYRAAGMDAEFVGHPILDEAKATATRDELRREFGAGPGPAIAVLPGSRKAEIERYLPLMAETCRRLNQRIPGLTFLLARAPNLKPEQLQRNLGAAGGLIKIIDGRACDVMAAADLCLAGSGTVTLEAAVMGTPMVVVGAVSRLTYALAKPFVDAPYIGLPNVIAGREVVPELVQRDATPERLTAAAADLLEHPEKAARIREDLAQVKAALGEGGASRRAAEAVSRRLWKEKGHRL
jgi:lipid-A-disaccharide synthase